MCNNNTYLRKLPLLNFTASLYPNASLENTYIISAQHLVSTTYSLFHTLLQLGLKPTNLSSIGKCYSTDPEAYDQMKKLGVDVCPSSMSFNSHQSFDEQYQCYMKKFVFERLKKIKDSNFKKIIVLDDGGELLSIINNFVDTDKLIGIEQTSAGFYKLKNLKFKLPIINLARSFAKLNFESPIIAKLVINTLVERIKNLPIQPQKVLIIGNGQIGSQIFKSLNRNYETSTFDWVPSKSSIKLADFEKSLINFDLILGCTGNGSFTPELYHKLKKNVILASTSSSDREFHAINLRRKIPLVDNCHENLFVDDIHLINCGFPINFDAQFRAIDVEDLQLTRSLLLASILQADTHSYEQKEFIPLDSTIQRRIIQKYSPLSELMNFNALEKIAI